MPGGEAFSNGIKFNKKADGNSLSFLFVSGTDFRFAPWRRKREIGVFHGICE